MARHLTVLNRELTNIATGRNKRLIVEMPPRHGKSELTSKALPAWYLGVFPDRDIILTSATDDLAAGFSMAARDALIEHGPSMFGVEVRKDQRSRHQWSTTAGGTCRAAGVGGAIMGRGANLLLVDDYFKSHEEALSETTRNSVDQWFMSTSSTRLTPDGAIVIVATRWHADDLIGRRLKDAMNGGEQWRVIRFPALAEENDPLGRAEGEPLWPERFDLKWMEERKSAYVVSGYEWMWRALYQQDPPATLNSEFSPDYFRDSIWFDEWPAPDQIIWKVMALDPSVGRTDKSDFSAIVMMALDRNMTMWVDADLQRRDPSRTVRDSIALGRSFNPHVFGVEANGFQAILQTTFWEECQRQGVMLNVQGVHNHQNKVERVRAGLTEYLHQGRFKFKRRSPGAALLVDQLKSFPTGKYDDGPDALEMAVRFMTKLVNEGYYS